MREPVARYLLPFDTYRLPQHLTDVLVVGTGIAGYSAALTAAQVVPRVMILAKGDPRSSNTGWAQGGIAAVLDDAGEDSPEAHARDTIEVGQGLCDEALVESVVRAGARSTADLRRLGARFDTADAAGAAEDGAPVARGLEGGHSFARILHARGDATGAEIRDALARSATEHPSVEIWRDSFLVDLLTDDDGRCRGALILLRGKLHVIWAGAVVLATGGYAQVYRESTNVPGATGDGVAVAFRAGATVQDMEFVQFHPTTLYLAGVPRLLITEAVRGEGAWIVDNAGKRFLLDTDERGELAPRDVISRAIMRHLERPEVAGVFLELAHLDPERVARRFPGVVRSCRYHGLDIGKDRIPIRPAAHYTIGGVRTDGEGVTDVAGLFAAGEVGASGLHGANRLASNSLLEGAVVGRRTGEVAGRTARANPPRPVPITSQGSGTGHGRIDVDDLRGSLKALLWREAGIERRGANLTGAVAAVQGWEGFAHRVGGAGEQRLTLLNMLGVACMLTEAALRREESRGTHYRRDFPERNDADWRVRIAFQRDAAEPLHVPVAVTQPVGGAS